MLTDEQRAARRKGISATDVAAILGLSPYRSPLAVQGEKLGLDEAAPRRETAATAAGHALEAVIAAQYARDNSLVRLVPGATVAHRAEPRALATPDFLVYVGDQLVRLVECKAVFSFQSAQDWGAPETDQVPVPYLVQVQWQMGVLGVGEVDVARFYAGQVAYWRVHYDAELFAHLLARCMGWWEAHVERREPVEPGPADVDLVKRLSPPASAPLAEANDVEAEVLREWRGAYLAHRESEATLAAAEARALVVIGEREGLRAGDMKATFKPAKGRATIDWPAVAREVGIEPEVLERHTRRAPDYRRVHCSWWREKSE